MKKKTSIKVDIIDDNELYDGLIKTYNNAQSLIKEGDILFERDSPCRSYTLYQLALEEYGKCIILFYYLVEFYKNKFVTESELKNSGFKDHQRKTKNIHHFGLTAIECYIKDIGNVIPLYESVLKDYQNEKLFDEKKNQSLYVCFKNKKFISPADSITPTECIEMRNRINNYTDMFTTFFIHPRKHYSVLAQLTI